MNIEEDDLNEVKVASVCIRRYLTWDDYVSMIENQNKPDKWSHNKHYGEDRGICLMLATNAS